MLEKFNDYEKQLINSTAEKLGCFYPNNQQLEKCLISESLTGNSYSTLATFSLSNYDITLPITTRKYHNRFVSQLYHSEFFKTQYKKITDVRMIVDIRNPQTKWKPVLIPNSRAILTIDCKTSDAVLNSKQNIRRNMKKHALHHVLEAGNDSLIKLTIDRFNIANLGSSTDECIEHDLYLSKSDNTRKYFTLANDLAEHKAILELQIEACNDLLTVYYINTYYDKTEKTIDQKIGLNSYYSIVKLADRIAQELGYSQVTIDFGVIFNYDYKLKIQGTSLGGTTMIFIKEL